MAKISEGTVANMGQIKLSLDWAKFLTGQAFLLTRQYLLLTQQYLLLTGQNILLTGQNFLYTGQNFIFIKDRSSILPGEGVEDILEGVPKFCTLRGRGDER